MVYMHPLFLVEILRFYNGYCGRLQLIYQKKYYIIFSFINKRNFLINKLYFLDFSFLT